ncbi:hypothetical protein, partial [Bacillus mycoides]
ATLSLSLREGTLKVEEIPKIHVWFDAIRNKIWTLDHRRLIAFTLAGIKNIPVEWASEEEIERYSWRMTTPNDGEEIGLLFSDKNKIFPIKRAGDYSTWSLEELKKLIDIYQN